MGNIAISPQLRVRDFMGRFVRDIGEATQEALLAVAHDGANEAERLAPTWLAGTFEVGLVAQTAVHWYSTHDWAMAAEEGIPAHVIPAKHGGPGTPYAAVNAPGEWQKDWPDGVLGNKPRKFFSPGPVQHPGTVGTHFLLQSYEAVKDRLLDEIRARI